MAEAAPSSLVTLLIDDSPTVLESIRTTLGVVGITAVDTCKNIGEARRRMDTKAYDLILCDYNLGPKQESGQQFLESLRTGGELPLGTIFIMVTAENGYERVVATAEIAPDDYLLKPFTPQQLLDRIFRANRKKSYLAPLLFAIDHQHLDKALLICDTLLEAQTKYSVDVLRFKAEILVTMGEDERAAAAYEAVLASKALPWAKMGLARILARNAKFAESTELLLDIVTENKVYLAAHDLLVNNAVAVGDDDAALEYAKQGLSISPGSSKRLKSTAEMAVKAGDIQFATGLLERAVNADSLATVMDPMARIKLIDVYCQSADYGKAVDQLHLVFKYNKAHPWAMQCCELLMLEAGTRTPALTEMLVTAPKWFREPARTLEDALLVLRIGLRGKVPETTLRPFIIAISDRYAYSTREIKDIELTVGVELANDADASYRKALQHNRTWMTQATTGQLAEALKSSLAEADRTLNERTILTAAAICVKYAEASTEDRDCVIYLLNEYVTTDQNQRRKAELQRQLNDPFSAIAV